MKSIISGFAVAFSLYSSIPMPQVAWEKKTMRFALSFLPLIGLLIAGAEFAWYRICSYLGVSPILYCVFSTLIPIIISGGIHLDGLTDTCDALCSYGEQEKKLAILKDPRVGAFGAMWQTCFLLLQSALFAQLYNNPKLILMALLGFAAARAIGGRTIVAIPSAKDSGLAHIFAENSEKRSVSLALAIEFAIIGLFMVVIHPVFGATFIALTLCWLQIHRKLCLKIFGGITGDLAGFLISITELLALAVGAFGGLIR